jgi:lipoyl synthase
VARDDLADGGAWLYGQTCRQIHAAVPGCGVELLIPDFNADPEQLAVVFAARPEVLAHNIETVPRIFRRIRPGFRYERSLEVLRRAGAAGLVTKSNLILGMGEERGEICAPPAASCSRSPSTCGRRCGITRSTGGCRPRSSTSWARRPSNSASPG